MQGVYGKCDFVGYKIIHQSYPKMARDAFSLCNMDRKVNEFIVNPSDRTVYMPFTTQNAYLKYPYFQAVMTRTQATPVDGCAQTYAQESMLRATGQGQFKPRGDHNFGRSRM